MKALALMIALGVPALVGCGAAPGSVTADAATADAATADAATADAATADAATADAATADAATVPDARPPVDARVSPDAALAPDAGVVGPEIDGLIAINEVMAVNVATLLDDRGVASSWVELYNPSGVAISLLGYALTDDLAAPRKVVLPGALVLPARGHLLLWLDGSAAGGAHVGIRLDAAGGVLALARPDGSFIDRIRIGAQETDVSAAREPDGSDHWALVWHVSPGTANRDGPGRPRRLDVPSEPPQTVPAAGDLSEEILGYDAIPELGFVVAPDAVAALAIAPREYVPAQLVYDGRSYGPVGLRLKGGGTFEPFDRKPSLRIDIARYLEGAKFLGVKDLTLNNMHSDFSMVHERLAYLVAREAGLPSSRANHAVLTVNGQHYGLYANVETVKKHLIERWFADESGPLFEATDVDFEASYLPFYELESGEDDRSLIAGLDLALTLADPDAALAAAAAYADLPQVIRFMALTAVIAQLDSFPYSDPGDDIHLYADPTSARLHILPWGMDETFYSGDLDVKTVHSVLARTCLASAACLQAWADQIWDILALTERIGLEAERRRVIAQIAPHVAEDTRKWYGAAEVAESQTALFWFLRERRARLGAMVPPPSVPR